MTAKRQFNVVWDAVEDTQQQAASIRVRSELMMSLAEVTFVGISGHVPESAGHVAPEYSKGIKSPFDID